MTNENPDKKPVKPGDDLRKNINGVPAKRKPSKKAVMIRKKRRRRKLIKKLIILIIIALIAISAIVWAAVSLNKKAKEAKSDKINKANEINIADDQKEDIPVKKDPVTITVSMTGDCTLGTDVNFDYSTSLNAYFEQYGPDYFLQNVKDIFENDDLTVVNFEGTLTESNNRQDKTFAFKAPASFAKILSGSGVEAANLANNHSFDYGQESFDDTKAALDAEGIIHFGYDETQVIDVKGIKVGLVGIYELNDHLGRTQQVKDNIAKVKEEGADLVLVVFHWGIEKDAAPTSDQITLARLAIDEGADLVCGHHPHVLQGLETYKGKNIVYSLGNFCFGGNSNPGDKDTIIYQQTFTITEEGIDDYTDYKIIPCSISASSGYNDYRPTPLTGDEADRVTNKFNERSALIPPAQ